MNHWHDASLRNHLADVFNLALMREDRNLLSARMLDVVNARNDVPYVVLQAADFSFHIQPEVYSDSHLGQERGAWAGIILLVRRTKKLYKLSCFSATNSRSNRSTSFSSPWTRPSNASLWVCGLRNS